MDLILQCVVAVCTITNTEGIYFRNVQVRIRKKGKYYL